MVNSFFHFPEKIHKRAKQTSTHICHFTHFAKKSAASIYFRAVDPNQNFRLAEENDYWEIDSAVLPEVEECCSSHYSKEDQSNDYLSMEGLYDKGNEAKIDLYLCTTMVDWYYVQKGYAAVEARGEQK